MLHYYIKSNQMSILANQLYVGNGGGCIQFHHIICMYVCTHHMHIHTCELCDKKLDI